MATDIQERYTPRSLGVDAVTKVDGLSGFICVTSGTLTVTRENGTTALNAFPVTAGVYHPIPMDLTSGSTLTLAGGASGTILF